MSLDVQVKIDPGDSKTKVDSVVGTLDKAEDTANAAKKAFQSLGESIRYMANQTAVSAANGFRSLADAIGYKLNTQITQTVRGFNSLAEAMQREHAMLATIRGDTQAYARDVQVLNSLMDRGKITAQEYDAALAAAGRRHGVDAAAAAPSPQGGGFLDGIAGQALAIAGPAAIAGKAISAIGDAFEEIRQKKQALNEASVDMLRYKDTIESARESTEGLRATSLVLGADIKETTGVFLSVADATSKLGKSEEQVAAITSNLGIMMKTDGKSIGDVGVVLERLQFAMEKGKIEAGDLSMIMRRFPPIGEALAKTFGMTQEQLLKVAESGKLTRTEIAKVWESLEKGDADALRKRQQQLVATFQNKDAKEQAKTFYEFRDAMLELQKQAAKTGATLDYEMKGMTLITPEMRKLAGETARVSEASEDLTNANTYLLDSWTDITDRGGLVGNRFVELKNKAHDLFNALRQLGTDKWGNTLDTRNTLARGIDEFIAFAHQGVQAAESFSAAWKKSSAEATAEAERLNKAFAKYLAAKPKAALTDELPGHAIRERAHEGFSVDVGMPDSPTNLAEEIKKRDEAEKEQQKQFAESVARLRENFHDAHIKLLEQEQEKLDEVHEKMASGFSNVLKEMSESAFDAEQSLGDVIRRLWMRMFQAASQQAFGAALAPSLPGFATGGSFMVGGHGGTDTTPVGFMASPGERVTIETPSQQNGERTSAPMNVTIHMDDKGGVQQLETPDGQRVIVKVVKRMFPQLKSELLGR